MKITPLAGTSFTQWIRLLYRNKWDLKYTGSVLLDFINILLFFPLRIREFLIYSEKIKATEILEPPVFILGHWRSGTTFLHNLMCQDPNLGYVTTLQAVFPLVYLNSQKYIRNMFGKYVPKKRPMDNMELSFESPQEEEVALVCVAPFSFFLGLIFPRKMLYYFMKSILFKGVSARARKGWKEAYMTFLKKITFSLNGQRLVIKNPSNTGRIHLLLEMFPNAKFVYIQRNPYVVFESTKHLHKTSMKLVQLQDIDDEALTKNIIETYHSMINRFLDEQPLIPKENYLEVRYEDLEKNPMELVETIYKTLEIPGFDQAKGLIQTYIESQKGYQKNKFEFSNKSIEAVQKHWQFALDKWGYEPPGS